MKSHAHGAGASTRSKIFLRATVGALMFPLQAYAQCNVTYTYNLSANAPALLQGTQEALEGQTVAVQLTGKANVPHVRKVTNNNNHPVEIQVTKMIAGVASGTKWVSLPAKNTSDPPGGSSYSSGVTLYNIKCPSPAATPPPPAPTVPVITEVTPNYYVSGVDEPKRKSAIIQGVTKDVTVKGMGINAATSVSVGGGNVTGSIVNRAPGAITIRFTSDATALRGERIVTVNFPVGFVTFKLVVLGQGTFAALTHTTQNVDLGVEETFTLTGTNLDIARLECSFKIPGVTTVSRTATTWQFRIRFNDHPGPKSLCLSADVLAPDHNDWATNYFRRTASGSIFLSSVQVIAPQPTLPQVQVQWGPVLWDIPPGTSRCAPQLNWTAVPPNPLIASLQISVTWSVPSNPNNPTQPTQYEQLLSSPPTSIVLTPQARLRAGENYQWRIRTFGPPPAPGEPQAYGLWSQPGIINVTAAGTQQPPAGPCGANAPVW